VYCKGNGVRCPCEPVTVIGDKPAVTTGCRPGRGRGG